MNWIYNLKNYTPWNEQEEKDKALMLSCISKFDDVLLRENEIVHMTSSAFIVNRKREKVLFIHHNIYNSWAWTGGHADGDEDFLRVAMKEAEEETGVRNVQAVVNDIFSLDILPVLSHIKKENTLHPIFISMLPTC
jgi:NUDIX domain.